MGCDIHGFVEARPYDFTSAWDMALNINILVHRNYDMFGLLFGVRNYASYLPVAEGRGIPYDASDEAKAAYQHWMEDAHSATWIAYDEIATINWNECNVGLDERISVYRKGEDVASSKFASSSTLSDLDYEVPATGQAIERGGVIYKREQIRFQDALSHDWEVLFALMKQLNDYYQQDNRSDRNVIESKATLIPFQPENARVRLVVWFDN